MKKLFSIFISIFLFCTMVGCTEQEINSPIQEDRIEESGTYTSKEDVSIYIYTYDHLPSNYITKQEAKDLGWQKKSYDLWEVASGMSIGGDYFGNYEETLPTDTKYHECDIDYHGGKRNAKRLVYGENGSIYYTEDHYETFEKLY